MAIRYIILTDHNSQAIIDHNGVTIIVGTVVYDDITGRMCVVAEVLLPRPSGAALVPILTGAALVPQPTAEALLPLPSAVVLLPRPVAEVVECA